MDTNGSGNPENVNLGTPFEIGLDKAYIECEQLFADADKLLNEGQIADAVGLLTKIIQRNPKFGKAYNHLGWVYETKYKNYAKAEENYRLALQYAPEYSAAYINFAYFLSTLQRFQELKTHLEKALTVSSVSKETIYNEFGIMYEQQGNPETALDYYVKAAMCSFDEAKFKKYKSGIERCKEKIELKKSLSDFLPINNY